VRFLLTWKMKLTKTGIKGFMNESQE